MTQQGSIQYNDPTSDFRLLTSGKVCPLTLNQAIQALRFGISVTGVLLYFNLYRLLSIVRPTYFL